MGDGPLFLTRQRGHGQKLDGKTLGKRCTVPKAAIRYSLAQRTRSAIYADIRDKKTIRSGESS